MKRHAFFDAAPAYPGGKRRLLSQIFRHIPSASEAPRFADAFCGSGVVALLAKARGHRVLASDIAERSYLAGRALVENGHLQLTDTDRTRLLAPRTVDPFVERHFAPRYLSEKHARAVDLMLDNLDNFEDLKRHLLKYAVLKYLLALMPFNQFSATGSYWQPLSEGDFDQIRQPYHIHLKTAFLSPATLLQRVTRTINRGIFGNGQENQVYQMDAFDFLDQHGDIDVLYLDPPYAGTLSYEKEFARLDQILALDLDASLPVSAFSQKGALHQVGRLFERTTHVPLTILSYGNAEASLEELVAMVRQHRSKVEAHEIQYRHMQNRASKQKNEANREFLVVARS
jgi:adenine-specific DNA methylase